MNRNRVTVISNKCITVRKVATPLRELTYHMGSHSVTCHPAEVTFPPCIRPHGMRSTDAVRCYRSRMFRGLRVCHWRMRALCETAEPIVSRFGKQTHY